MDIFVVVNPVSGDINKQKVVKYIEQTVDEQSKLHFFYTTGNNDSAQVKGKLHEINPDRVVVIGGDGTVRLVAELILHQPIALAIVPAGSANGLATDLGIEEDWKEAVKIALGGVHKSIDVCWVNDTNLCLHLADFGLNARLVKGYQENDRRGMLGYGLELLRTLAVNESHFDVTFEHQGEARTERCEMAVFANSRMYGTGAVINPDGQIDDGRIELCLVKEKSLKVLLEMLLDPEKPFSKKLIEVYTGKGFEIHLDRKQPFQIDGEYLGDMDRLKVAVEHHALKVIVEG